MALAGDLNEGSRWLEPPTHYSDSRAAVKGKGYNEVLASTLIMGDIASEATCCVAPLRRSFALTGTTGRRARAERGSRDERALGGGTLFPTLTYSPPRIPGTPYLFRRDAPSASTGGSDQWGPHSLLSPSGPGQRTSLEILGRRGRRERASMNAIPAVHPYRHEGLWVFDDETVGLRQEPFVAGADGILVWMGDPPVSSVSRDIPPDAATGCPHRDRAACRRSPRPRPGTLSRPIVVVPSGRRTASRDHPAVSGLLRAGPVSAHPPPGGPDGSACWPASSSTNRVQSVAVVGALWYKHREAKGVPSGTRVPHAG